MEKVELERALTLAHLAGESLLQRHLDALARLRLANLEWLPRHLAVTAAIGGSALQIPLGAGDSDSWRSEAREHFPRGVARVRNGCRWRLVRSDALEDTMMKKVGLCGVMSALSVIERARKLVLLHVELRTRPTV